MILKSVTREGRKKIDEAKLEERLKCERVGLKREYFPCYIPAVAMFMDPEGLSYIPVVPISSGCGCAL